MDSIGGFMLKLILSSKLFMGFVYTGAGLLAGHITAFLASTQVQAILAQLVKDPTPLPGSQAIIDKWIITAVMLLSTIPAHYFHEGVVAPIINKSLPTA